MAHVNLIKPRCAAINENAIFEMRQTYFHIRSNDRRKKEALKTILEPMLFSLIVCAYQPTSYRWIMGKKDSLPMI